MKLMHRLPLAVAALGLTALAFAQAALTDGEVRKIDAAQQKITLKHGEIKNLDMPPMTMAYKVKDAALLQGLAPGDHVKFAAEKLNGTYTVTRIEKSQ